MRPVDRAVGYSAPRPQQLAFNIPRVDFAVGTGNKSLQARNLWSSIRGIGAIIG